MADRPAHAGHAAALVFAAGQLPPAAVTDRVVLRCLEAGAFVVAADGGLAHARALGVEPHRIVGDFDSVSPELLSHYLPHIIERHTPAKDDLDLELALTAARQAGASELSVLGAFGDRLDQSLAAVLIAARLTLEGPRIDLHGGGHSAWPLATGASVTLALPVGTTVSVLALAGDAVVRAAGLHYPLADLLVPFGTGLGVSNAVAATGGSVTCVSGLIAVIAEYRAGRG